jgi:hypothetical protein
MQRTSVASHGTIGIALVLVVWAVLFVVNVLELAPSIHFRGIRFSGGDFGQYFMGGVVANERIWDDLYPIDLATVPSPDKASIAPRLADALRCRGADVSWKYIYPPPLAVFLAPLDWISFPMARMVFSGILFGSFVWFIFLFRRECDDWNIPPMLSNLLVVAIGTGIPICESVMLANATPFVMLSSLLILRSIRRNRIAGSVLAFALAGLFKGISVAWVPILFLGKRWRILAAGVLVGCFVLSLPHLMGAPIGLWSTFLFDIIPESRKTYWIGDGNLGLPSLIAWISGGRLSATVERLLAIAQFLLWGTVYGLAWRMSRTGKAYAEGLAIFLATLVFQLFSPLCWPHYACNIVGFLPLCLSLSGVRSSHRLCRRQWISLAVIAIAFLLVWYPIGNAVKYALRMPIFGFGRTFGYLLMLLWGLWSLCHPACSVEK